MRRTVGVCLLLTFAACRPTPRPAPPPTPDRTQEFTATCSAIWLELLERPIDSAGLQGCLNQARAGGTADTIRAEVKRSAEYKKLQERPPARPGVVRADRFVTVDDQGPFLAQGTSLFWALWGEIHDRPRLERNLQTARDGGMDYIRVFAQVGGSSWSNRGVGPADAGWSEAIRSLTDRVYDRYGMRVQWTVFAWSNGLNAEGRRQAVDRLLDAIDGRAHKVFAIEVSNEAFQNGPDPAEARALAARIRARFPGLVAISAPRGDSCERQAEWYRGSAATLITLHLDRTTSKEGGMWRPVRQPWRESRFSCPEQPLTYANNEPIGPNSSVAADNDPVRLVMQAAVSWIGGMGAYVYHTDAGIRGGGAEDLARGRVANLWEVARWGETVRGLRAARAALPPDVPNWTRGSSKPPMFDVATFEGPSNPGRGTIDRVYCAWRDSAFACAAINIVRPTTLTAKRAMSVRVIHPATGAVLQDRVLSAGNTLVLPPDPGGVVLVSR